MLAGSIDLQNLSLCVAGARVSASERELVWNPATGALAASAPVASSTLLEQAVAEARAAQRRWARDPESRRQTLLHIARVITEHQQALAHTLCLEIGVPFKIALDEVTMAAAYMVARAKTALAVDVIHNDARQTVRVERSPIGVIGAIIPWNAPLLIACEKISSALLGGNTVVLKTSPLAPLAILQLGELLFDVVPPGVLTIVNGSDALGALLVAHPDVGMISFTGSISAGRSIMSTAAPQLKRLSLELGGNDAAIVLPDVDVNRVAAKLYGAAFYRSGQICAAIKRLYIHEEIFEPLTAALQRLAEAAVLGSPFDPRVNFGPVSNGANFVRIKRLVENAVAAGAKARCGGAPLADPGNFYPPTLVTDIAEGDALVCEEQFGPVLPLMPFAHIDEAIAAANSTSFGLGNSVWTSNVDYGASLAQHLESGSVWVNRHGLVLPDVPFGGMKQSGIGRANGLPGVDSYCELKTVSVAMSRESARPRAN